MADPEISAMETISSAMEGLDQDARERVINWSIDRFNLRAMFGKRSSLQTPPGSTPSDGGAGTGGMDLPPPQFEHFAELFEAADPKTDVDKALVAGYWFQIIKGQDKLQAADLQTELKNLGHQLSNITTSLSGNVNTKPARILQLAKSGSSKQGRKTYKLTAHGVKVVKKMIEGTEEG
jgi:hypothetical protein